jgi:hypothetical protein
MANWQISYNENGVLQSAAVSFRNVYGSPIRSVTQVADHAAGAQAPAAGIFIITTGADSTVSVTAKSSADMKSPNLTEASITVVDDGETSNLTVIPGLDILFFPFSAGLTAEIGVGCYWDTTTYWWNRVTSLGLGIAGMPGPDVSVSVLNSTGQAQSNSKLVVTNAARIVNSVSASQPIYSFRQTGLLNPTADEDLLGKAISFTNFNDAYSIHLVDILVGGLPIDVYDVTNSVLIVGGAELWCDGSTVYRFADASAYQRCEFVLSEDLAAEDTAQIYVSDGGSFVELFDIVTGEYVSGATGTYLTSDDCGVGVVLTGDDVSVIMRLNPPTDKTISLNQRQFSVRIYSESV